MTSRRRAEEFAAAIDGGGPGVSERVDATFVELVEQLRDVDVPTMRSDFATDLRARLMDEAATVLTEPVSPPSSRRDASVVAFPASPRRRAATAAATAAIVLGSTVGVAAASQSALPGEALYPVKRGIEHVEVAVATSEHAKGKEYLEQASTRLDEISDLTVAHADDPATADLVRKTLESFSSQAGDGADALMQAYDDTSDASNISDLRSFADTSATRLDALSGALPSTADDALAHAADVLRQLDQQAQKLCPGCSNLPTLTLSGALLDLTQGLVPPLTNDPNAPGSKQHGSAQPSTPNASTQGGQLTDGSATPDLPNLSGFPPGDQLPDTQATTDGSSPGLPGFTGLDPTQIVPTSGQQSPGGGVTIRLPGGGVTVKPNLPSVPLPTVSVDLSDPLGSVPQVIDDVTGGLGLGGGH